MALRTNTKVVRNRIREYIRQHVFTEDFEGTAETFPVVARYVMDSFEYCCSGLRPVYNMQVYFEKWLPGLPSCGLGDFYLRSYENAIDILGDILEETEEERKRFTYEQSEHLLTSLIYRELLKGIKEYAKKKGTN